MMIFILIFLLIPSICFAAPTISSSSGTILQNNSVVVSGTNFGTNSAVGTTDLQWLGANIEAGTVGTALSASGWSFREHDAVTAEPLYSNSYAHSGSKSIMLDYSGTDYRGWMIRNHGSEIQKLYLTFWVRAHRPGTSTGQWKVLRLSKQESASDTTPEIAFFNWSPPSNDPHWVNRPSTTTSYWEAGVSGYYIQYNEAPAQPSPDTFDKWCRLEMYFEGGTQGNANGTFKYWFHDPTGTIRLSINYPGNLLVYGESQTDRIQYVLLGHYAGDGYDGGLTTYWDDIFLQVGGLQRVEIGDNAVWANCTHREIQVPTSWADGSITFTVNRGSFALGSTAYLFVIDSAGAASSGYEITFSYGGSAALTGGTGSISLTGGTGSLTW